MSGAKMWKSSPSTTIATGHFSNIDFNGNVHADQFSMFRSFGDVQERPFSESWQNTSNEIMSGLKEHHGQSRNWNRSEVGFAV
jgi:MoaA/NifB/PqqE/SkfB family radical SAM enzyme